MKRNNLRENWMQLKAEFKKKWEKLPEEDLDKTQGDFESLVGAVQKHYGLVRDAAEKEINAFIGTLDEAKFKAPKAAGKGEEHEQGNFPPPSTTEPGTERNKSTSM